MIAFGLFVTVSVLPTVLNAAAPAATEGPVGFARPSAAKQDATSAHSSFTRGAPRNDNEAIKIPPVVLRPRRSVQPESCPSEAGQTPTFLSIVRRSRYSRPEPDSCPGQGVNSERQDGAEGEAPVAFLARAALLQDVGHIEAQREGLLQRKAQPKARRR